MNESDYKNLQDSLIELYITLKIRPNEEVKPIVKIISVDRKLF